MTLSFITVIKLKFQDASTKVQESFFLKLKSQYVGWGTLREKKMENDKKIRKRIFMKALSIVRAVNEVDSVLDKIGINLDFDDAEKPVGRAMGNLLTTPKEVACAALGLTLKTEKGYCTGAYKGQLLTIEVEVYYPDFDDENTAIPFSITFEGMWDLLDLAAKDTACAAKVWDCFVNRDTEAKKWIKNVCDITGWGEVDER